jgi:hypothetical protein
MGSVLVYLIVGTCGRALELAAVVRRVGARRLRPTTGNGCGLAAVDVAARGGGRKADSPLVVIVIAFSHP